MRTSPAPVALPTLLVALAVAVLACSDDAGETGEGGADAGVTSSSGTAQGGAGQGGSGSPGPTVTGAGGETSGTGGSGAGSAVDLPLEAFCAGEGAIPVPGAAEDEPCLEDIAKETFKFAICSCTDVTIGNDLDTSAFHSVDDVELLAGSVGANGDFTTMNTCDLGGSLWVGAATSSINECIIRQNLRTGGEAEFNFLTAERAAYTASGLSAVDGAILGDLHIPEGETFDGVTLGGELIREPVEVPEPCNCDEPVPIGAIVDAFEATNDNEELGVPTSIVEESGIDLELPCGRFFFSAIAATNAITIRLTGRTVIAIDGDLTTQNSLTIELDEDATLDLFVDGEIVIGNTVTIGDQTRPVATRIYVSGDGVELGNSLVLGGNVYMPNSPLELGNSASVAGALFAQSVTIGNSAAVAYDAAIVDLDGCEVPPGGCDDCGDCENPAPACGEGGVCGPCTTDDDCCGPTVCLPDGTCGYVGPN